MFNHILMPLDGSSLAEASISCTLAFARAFNTRVTLLRVMEKSEQVDCLQPIDPLDWSMCKMEAGTYLEELHSRFAAEGIETESVLKEGEPAQRILETLQERNIDLIVVSSHGRSGPSGWHAGSVARKIASRARTSLMILRSFRQEAPSQDDASDNNGGHPSGRFRFKKILVPLDGSRRSEYVLAPATTLTQFHDAELVFAHVAARPEMPRWTQPTPEDMELSDRIVKRNLEEMQQHLDAILSRLSVRARIRLESADDAAIRLHELEREENPDLVIISAHGYSGSSKWTCGSVANTFVEYGAAPLLMVQDFPGERIETTEAESATAEKKGH